MSKKDTTSKNTGKPIMSGLHDLSIDEKTLKVKEHENEQREFKIKFENKALWKYAKTMISFANKNGGVIFFGIEDHTQKLVGVTGTLPDELVFAQFLKEYFEPEIQITLETKKQFGKDVFYVLVKPSLRKPIICKKRKTKQSQGSGKTDKEILREGAIYYRYSSSTVEIKYPEFSKILEERVQNQFNSIIKNMTLVNKIGYDRVGMVDVANLSENSKNTSIYMSKEAAENIDWIKEGSFSENSDAADKAYYVTREIEIKSSIEVEVPVDPSKTHKITKTDLIKQVKINSGYINAILWKLKMLDNDKYHITMHHGKNILHKFTEQVIEKILKNYPLENEKRKEEIIAVHRQYKDMLKLES